jgi:hypothetical protein
MIKKMKIRNLARIYPSGGTVADSELTRPEKSCLVNNKNPVIGSLR